LRKQKENVKINIMAENKTDWKSREVGSLWSKGNYHTGKVTLRNLDLSNVSKDSNVSVVMFKNKEQNEQGTRPEYNIYLVDTDDNNSQSYKKSNNASSGSNEQKNESNDQQSDEDGVDALFG